MIQFKINKKHVATDNKSFTYYLNFENDLNEYEFNLNYSNSVYYKGVSGTLSLCRDNFVKTLSNKRLKYIKRFTIKQAHDVFNFFNLNNVEGKTLLNDLYNASKNTN